MPDKPFRRSLKKKIDRGCHVIDRKPCGPGARYQCYINISLLPRKISLTSCLFVCLVKCEGCGFLTTIQRFRFEVM